MPRYELRQGDIGQFWEIWQINAQQSQKKPFWLTSQPGKHELKFLSGAIGSSAKYKTKYYINQEQLQADYDKQIKQHLKENYILVTDQPLIELPEIKALPSNSALEENVINDFYNKEKWLMYADWLQTQADSRGELIILHFAYQEAIQAQDTLKQQDILKRLTELSPYTQYYIWAGKELAEILYDYVFEENNFGGIHLEWYRGFIQKARIAMGFDWERPSMLDILKILFNSPASKFIETLSLGLPEHDGMADFQETLSYFSQGKQKYSLRSLYIGDFEYPDEIEISWTEVGNIEPIYNAFPYLEYLKVQGGGIFLGDLKHNCLKHLVLETGALPEESVQSIGKAELPVLEKLEVWFGDNSYGAGGNHTLLTQLWDGSAYPHLYHLGLKNAEFTDEIPITLVTSSILKQIKTLDLSLGTMTDTGAQVFIDHYDVFAHLEHINLDENFISEEMQESLKNIYKDKISLKEQEEEDDGYFYVSVGE